MELLEWKYGPDLVFPYYNELGRPVQLAPNGSGRLPHRRIGAAIDFLVADEGVRRGIRNGLPSHVFHHGVSGHPHGLHTRCVWNVLAHTPVTM